MKFRPWRDSRTAHPLALMVLGALGLWLGFPNPLLHMPPLVLCWPAALYVLGQEAESGREALRRGWLSSLAGAAAAMYWVAVPVHDVGRFSWPLAIPCALAVGAYVGVYGGLFCLGAHLLRSLPSFRDAVACGILWYLLELLRGFLLTGFPWLVFSTAFAPWPFAIQGAALLGSYGLGAVLVTAAVLLAQAMQKLRQQESAFFPSLMLGMTLLVLPAAYGLWQLSGDPVETDCAALEKRPDAFPVIFVEGNIDQNQKWVDSLQLATVELYIDLSRQAVKEFRARAGTRDKIPLLIWPETAMPFYYDQHARHRPAVESLVREAHVNLLLGAPGIVRNTPQSFQMFNRAYLVDTQGRISGYYDKTQLVPFGEYLPPWLDFAFFRPYLQGIGDFTQGISAAPLRAGNLALGLLICYESIFPEIAQQRVADGANVLVNISNDGWFGDSAAPEQHLQLAIMRAVEQGRWLLRGTNTGISAVVDHRGRLIMRGTQFKAQSLTSCALRMEEKTPFHRIQQWLPWISLIIALYCLLPLAWQRRS